MTIKVSVGVVKFSNCTLIIQKDLEFYLLPPFKTYLRGRIVVLVIEAPPSDVHPAQLTVGQAINLKGLLKLM